MLIKYHSKEIENLVELGFTVNPLNRLFRSLEEAYQYSLSFSKDREDLNYPIDGGVIKINSNEDLLKLGIIGKTYRGWSAIKFAPDELTTKILDITYQVGRTGKITPVAELEPVEIQGTIVKRATLHNFKEVKDYNIHVNDTIVIRKAGDIIPEVVSLLPALRNENALEINLITNCPSCNTILQSTQTNIDLFCPNREHCPAQIKLRIAYYCSRGFANISGLSEKTIEKFIEQYNVSDFTDLYSLNFNDISTLEGFGEKSADNFKTNIEKSRHIDDYKLISALSIEGIGIENSKLITLTINNLNQKN
jgi:DNA ligase (NAD+)